MPLIPPTVNSDLNPNTAPTCVYELKNTIAYYKSYNSPVFACFLDASKAFDRVNYWKLFSKLIKRGVSLIIVRLLSFWYSSQQFCVKWGNSTSAFFFTGNGVRQGGILSPRLFTFYLDDLSLHLKSVNIGCFIDDVCVNHFFYADDMCILAPSPSGLKLLLDICASYGTSHDIIFHPVKSQCMVFRPPRYKLNIPSIYMNDAPLIYTESIKYLGVFLSDKLSDDLDMQRQLRSLYAGANTILSKFARCSVNIKCLLIDSYCFSFYCPYLWCSFNVVALNRLRVAYNNVYRRILGYSRRDSASAMFASHNIANFDCKIRKLIYGFKTRVHLSDNMIIRAVNMNYNLGYIFMHRFWQQKLYTSSQ